MLPDEHGDTHPPPPSVAPVVVRPIEPHQSRTIRDARLWQIWSFIVAAAPDILSALVYVITSDKRVYEFVAEWFPPTIRYAAMTALITYAQQVIKRRKQTVAPIAGTDAAIEAPLAYKGDTR